MHRLGIALLTSASLLALTSVGSAADLSPVYKGVPAPAPVWSWTGFYAGFHGGAGWGTTEAAITSFAVGAPIGLAIGGFNFPVAQTQQNGFLGGVQAGYNWHSGWLVVGLEGDISATNLKGTSPCLIVLSCTAENNWIATGAVRVGVTADRIMFYMKGGAGFSRAQYSASLNLGALGNFTTSVTDNRVGPMIGLGVEYAMARNWSAKLEYDYIDFGKRTENFNFTVIGAPITIGTEIKQQVHMAKGGLNYRF